MARAILLQFQSGIAIEASACQLPQLMYITELGRMPSIGTIQVDSFGIGGFGF